MAFYLNGLQVEVRAEPIRVERKYLLPTLILPVTLTSKGQDPNKGQMILHWVMKVAIKDPYTIIGYTKTESLSIEIGIMDHKTIESIMTLDYQLLAEIEKQRLGQDLHLTYDIRCLAKSQNDVNYHECVGITIDDVRVSKSDWVEKYLNELNFRKVTLLEVPVLEHLELNAVIDDFNDAYRQYLSGDYKQSLSKCRNSLEGVASKIKSKGFKTFEIQPDGRKRTIPDWTKFFQDKDIGDITMNIYIKVIGFLVPSSHHGTIIDRNTALFGLFETYSLLQYVISQYQQLNTESQSSRSRK